VHGAVRRLRASHAAGAGDQQPQGRIDGADEVHLSEQGGAPDTAAVFASQQVDCTTLAPTGPIVPAQTPGSRELESSGDVYHFNWKTDSAWAGTCRQLIVRLQDVRDPVAYFRFT
jgi:hypothetical protein